MFFYFILYLFIIFILNNFISKKKFLQSNTGSSHQLFVNCSVPLTGGIIIFFPTIYFFGEYQKFMIINYFLILLLGIMSDLNIVSSSKKRFFLQFLLVSLFVIVSQLEVLPTRITLIDNYFQGSIFSYLFTIFCFLVLINGSNFIDGLNGLLLSYVMIIFFYLFQLDLIGSIIQNNSNFLYLVFILIFVLLLNFNNKLFLGDGGSYSLGFLLGFILIKIYNLNNSEISPYFIILLLWYPCFENLFSILRKFKLKINPLKPDNMHLHHYLFSYLKKKFKYNDLYANNFASIIINVYNCFIFYIGSTSISYTKIQLGLIFSNIFLYIFFYSFLKKKNKLFKK